jgi:cellulose synthase/poly-beta-1,6-N-acetylglucosamine synthase-like glycosyltransferase
MSKTSQFFLKYDRQIQRALEILPGFVSWNLILFPIWGGLLWPMAVAYFVLLFDIFWIYKSFALAIFSIVAHLRIQASKKMDWLEEVKPFPDWTKVQHIIIIPTVQEPVHLIERALKSLLDQKFPKKQLSVVVAFEERGTGWEERAAEILRKFRGKFGDLLITKHKLAKGEAIGKHSNCRKAILEAKKILIDPGKFNPDYVTVTSSDVDHVFHPNHFAYLTFKFLDSPHRYERFWQAAIVFYNNFWRLPALTRVSNTFGSIWNIAILARTDRIINQQNYSLSYGLLKRVGFWDPKVIPEDYHLFFKAFFLTKGRVEVEPIYLPLSVDAAESTSFLKTLKNQYEQFKRWAWGVSDDPYVIKNYFLSTRVSFWAKTLRTIRIIEDHFLWPVNWFIVTLGINILSVINPRFSRTAIGFNLPRLSSTILSICLVSLAIILYIDSKQRPPRPREVPRWKAMLIPFEFILMPISGFIFTALPGLDAHTRLMLGKYLEYRVTEKI